MILAVHSDAGYCNETKSRSRAGGHFFLSHNVDIPPNNGAILTVATIIKAVMSSAAEAELGAIFINAKEAVIRTTNTHRDGASATTNTDSDGQLDRRRRN